MQSGNTSAPVEGMLAQAQAAFGTGDMVRAASGFRAVLNADPDCMPAVAGLGVALAITQNFEESLPFLERASRHSPQNPTILEALGVACSYTGRNADAAIHLRKALRFGGNNPGTMANLASVLNENGKFTEAEAMFRNCLRKTPDNLQAQHNLALLYLLKGELQKGWPGFELRNTAAGRPAPVWAQRCAAPEWRGEEIGGRSIVLYAEQGLGDTIQFVRYADSLAARGARVVIQCQHALTELLSAVDGAAACISTDDDAPDVDYKASLLSMPKLLNTSLETIPADVPYIGIDLNRSADWQKILESFGDRPRIGLVWSGNPENKTDYKRSMVLDRFAPILNRPDCTILSLQVGTAAKQVADMPEATQPHILFPEIKPFTDVAAALKNLDLVISVDTALAHLAGALGIPVWTLISHFPDWRWMLERDDTPWYPTMRLFRQPAVGDWDSVIGAVSTALDAHSFR